MNNASAHSPLFVRFCTMNDPAGRIAAHVDLAFECMVREQVKRDAEAAMRAAVSDAGRRLAA